MRTSLYIVFSALFAISSLEGAADAVQIESFDPDQQHEEHTAHTHHSEQHHGGKPASDTDTETDTHGHVCHCGVHAPVLGSSWPLQLARTPYGADELVSNTYALSLRPPPLPPPIA
jgi:hypothetical protein